MKKKIMSGLMTLVLIALSVTVTMGSGAATQPTQAARGDAANWLQIGYDNSYTAYNPIDSTIGITNVAKYPIMGQPLKRGLVTYNRSEK